MFRFKSPQVTSDVESMNEAIRIMDPLEFSK